MGRVSPIQDPDLAHLQLTNDQRGSFRRLRGATRPALGTTVVLLGDQLLFVIEQSTRRVHIAGIASQAGEPWMRNMAMHLTDGFDGFLIDKENVLANQAVPRTEPAEAVSDDGSCGGPRPSVDSITEVVKT